MKVIKFYFITFLTLLFLLNSANAEETLSGGLGLSKEQWEENHNKIGRDDIMMTDTYIDSNDNEYNVRHWDENIEYIDYQLGISDFIDSEEELVIRSEKMIPSDAEHIKTYQPHLPDSPETFVRLYKSKYLEGRFEAEDFKRSEPGEFIILYHKYPNGISGFLIALGNNP